MYIGAVSLNLSKCTKYILHSVENKWRVCRLRYFHASIHARLRFSAALFKNMPQGELTRNINIVSCDWICVMRNKYAFSLFHTIEFLAVWPTFCVARRKIRVSCKQTVKKAFFLSFFVLSLSFWSFFPEILPGSLPSGRCMQTAKRGRTLQRLSWKVGRSCVTHIQCDQIFRIFAHCTIGFFENYTISQYCWATFVNV
jgi:hypothetical protein